MHPLLRGRKLGLYLFAWAPIAYALSFILVSQSHVSWLSGVALSVPLCLIYAFICLSARYPCQAVPLRGDRISSLLITHLGSSLVAAGLWVLLAKFLVVTTIAAPTIDAVLPSIFGMGLVLYLLAVAVHYVFIAVAASQKALAREAEARVLAGEAELRALKAQINPHFLFNSLHSISALTSIDGAKAREMCVLLSAFLRSTLGLSEKGSIPFEEELGLARGYLAIEKVRFGDRLGVEEEIDAACASIAVPPLLLQPMVENAVIHGIANLIEPGFIRISAQLAEGALVIAVENSFDADSPPRARTGFGLASVRKRLYARYGGDARLTAGPREGIFRVELRLPAGENAKP